MDPAQPPSVSWPHRKCCQASAFTRRTSVHRVWGVLPLLHRSGWGLWTTSEKPKLVEIEDSSEPETPCRRALPASRRAPSPTAPTNFATQLSYCHHAQVGASAFCWGCGTGTQTQFQAGSARSVVPNLEQNQPLHSRVNNSAGMFCFGCSGKSFSFARSLNDL